MNDNDLDRLLRPPVMPLPISPGSFDRIRHTVSRRRRVRAAVGAAAALVVIGALVPAATQLRSDNRDIVVPIGQLPACLTASPAETSEPTPTTPTETPAQTTNPSESPTPERSAAVPAPSDTATDQPSTCPTASPSETSEPTPTTPTDTPAQTTNPSESPAPGRSAAVPAPSGTAPAPAPSASATAPRCRSAELDMELGRTEGAAGNRYAALIFTNRGDRVCHLQGRPGVSVLDASRQQIGPAADDEAGNPHQMLDLRSGDKASTVLHWASDAAGPCRPASSWLRVYPPGDTEPLVIPASIQLCGDIFTVRNLTSGSDGIAG
jgi:hypothetical protein